MHVKGEARKKLEKYAWPGGYPIYYLARDGWREDDGRLVLNTHDRSENVCCPDCATDTDQWPDIIITGQDIHYEGEPLQCEYCNKEIESAYGDPDAEDDGDADQEENPSLRAMGRSSAVHDYHSAASLLGMRDNVVLSANTTLESLNDHTIGVKLFSTYVVKYGDDGDITLNSGGYITATTANRMNQFLPGGVRVSLHPSTKRGTVRLPGGEQVPFQDGMVIHTGHGGGGVSRNPDWDIDDLNPDGWPESKLEQFVEDTKTGAGQFRVGARLFPEHNKRTQGRVAGLLHTYTSFKLKAVRARLAGRIQEALTWERHADKVYDRLPEWAKW